MKMRKFRSGGDTSDMDSMSFSEAFRKARAEKGAGETFMWRGKRYSTNIKEEGYKPRKLGEEGAETSGGPTARRGSRGTKSESKRAELPSDRASGFRSQVEETGMTPEERTGAVRNLAVGAASMLPASRLARGAMETGRLGSVGVRGMTMAEREREAAAAAESARKIKRLREAGGMRGTQGGRGYAKGGAIKSSASKRADGCAVKGKTRGKMI